MSSMCCCSPCRPAYRRHVDNIFPAVPEEGLVKNKMETLVYYALTCPEKLDRIGEVLANRIGRDIYRGRKELAFIGMEAMDQLLSACHVRTLNLFVESFLKTIQKLLESDQDFQIQASKSFLHFSQIAEETPSYHRTYNFFIDRFSQMCHSPNKELRTFGLQGLLGVIRKTVNEDLAENIWETKHMDKIVPSLLFNMEAPKSLGSAVGEDDDEGSGVAQVEDPHDLDNLAANPALAASQLAEQILRELVSSASFSSIKAILNPVLKHIDLHTQWEPENQFCAVYTFNVIMYSIQVDLAYILIEKVIGHMDKTSSVVQKSHIASVLSKIIGIGVGESTVGPAVLEIINSLLKHLQKSAQLPLSFEEQSSIPMQTFQSAVIKCLGEYTAKMPDFQKSENMIFILSKVPHDPMSGHALQLASSTHAVASGTGNKAPPSHRNVDSEVQHILMKALYAVADKHNGTLFSSSFSTQLLHSLLRLLMSHDADVRLLVLQTFQILADRHNNLEKLGFPTMTPANLDIAGIRARSNRSDQLFAQKSLFKLYSGFRAVLAEQPSTKEFLDAMYTTVAILTIEMSASDESTIYLVELIDGMQNTAVQEVALTTENRFALHAIAVSLLALLTVTSNIPELDSYVAKLMEVRSAKAQHMLPPTQEDYNPGLNPDSPDTELLIDTEVIKEALKTAGKDIDQMGTLPRYVGGNSTGRRSRSPGGTVMAMNSDINYQQPLLLMRNSSTSSRRPSCISQLSGTNGLGQDLMLIDDSSMCSTPNGFIRKPLAEEVSVKELKRILEGKQPHVRELKKQRRDDLQGTFLQGVYQELVCQQQNLSHSNGSRKGVDLQVYVQDVFHRLSFGDKMSHKVDSGEEGGQMSLMDDPEPYKKFFPEIYLY